jgi:hypothetical protein
MSGMPRSAQRHYLLPPGEASLRAEEKEHEVRARIRIYFTVAHSDQSADRRDPVNRSS